MEALLIVPGSRLLLSHTKIFIVHAFSPSRPENGEETIHFLGIIHEGAS